MRRSVLSLSVLVVCLLASLLVSGQSGLGHLQGVVLDTSGTPLSGAVVSARSDDPRAVPARTTISGADGAFSLADLPRGHYRITASRAGFLSQTREADVSPSAPTTLRFALMSAPPPAPPPATSQGQQANRAQDAMRGMEGGIVGGVSGGIVGGLASAPSVAYRLAMPAPFNTEAYDKIDDSAWQQVRVKPLSTFSTDVDTASYANVRRFLNQGQMPPPDAVRIEEMINYFSYDYAEPTGAAPFSVTTSLGDCAWNPSHKLALIGLQARHLDRSSTPPRNLVFLVDVSGSMMAPNKLPLVRTSLAMLARNLTERDRIALVVYAGAAGTVLPSTSGADTSTILQALNSLEAGGSTNGAQGIQLAYDIARRNFITGGANRVVLATDGDFNVGVTNRGALVRLIEEQRQSGVTLSVLGFGMGNIKDSTLEQLADRGNGNYSYIDSLSEAQKVLVEEAGGTLVTVAKDVKLQVEFNPKQVAAYRLIGYENRRLEDRDFNDDAKDAGDMGAGHSVTAIYELELARGTTTVAPDVDPLKYQQTAPLSTKANRAEVMTVKVRYKAPDGDSSSLISVAVPLGAAMSAPLGFAASVAEFGMLLRDGAHKGGASYAHAMEMARRYQGVDRHGHRAEFARLVAAAQAISGSEHPRESRQQ